MPTLHFPGGHCSAPLRRFYRPCPMRLQLAARLHVGRAASYSSNYAPVVTNYAPVSYASYYAPPAAYAPAPTSL